MHHAQGPLLSVDVSERTADTEEIDDVLAGFIGGRGVGTKLAADRIPTDVEPLSPDNRVFFTTGPLQYSNMSFTGRMSATGLAPHTGGLLSANGGGPFPAAIARFSVRRPYRPGRHSAAR